MKHIQIDQGSLANLYAREVFDTDDGRLPNLLQKRHERTINLIHDRYLMRIARERVNTLIIIQAELGFK